MNRVQKRALLRRTPAKDRVLPGGIRIEFGEFSKGLRNYCNRRARARQLNNERPVL